MSRRIGINALFLRPGRNGGIETYLRELIRGFAELDISYSVHVYLPKEARGVVLPKHRNIEIHICDVEASRPLSKYWYEQVSLPKILREDKIELLHSLAYIGPVFSGVHHIVTVHDLNFIHFGSLMSLSRRIGLGIVCVCACHRANIVIAVSEFTRLALLKNLLLEPRRVITIHEAGGTTVAGDLPPEVARLGRYIAAFGGKFPNKNIERLIAAYARIAPSCPSNLVIMGVIAPAAEKALNLVSEDIRSRIHLIVGLTDGEVAAVLKSSDIFIQPSVYEGFGMTVLEAQSHGAVVVASGISALPEIAGEGASYFDPLSLDDMGRAMLMAINDSQLRTILLERGRDNLRRFSWRETALATIGLYDKVLQNESENI